MFQQLLKNYEQEKQLAFENTAIADKDGTVRSFVADHRDETANLTVFASLKKDALIVVEQFLACGVKPTIIHFEHCHTARPALDALYRKLVKHGLRFNELEIDALCYLPSAL